MARYGTTIWDSICNAVQDLAEQGIPQTLNAIMFLPRDQARNYALHLIKHS